MIEWLENAIDFSNTLNASISASWLILVVIGLRFLLKKAPKWLNVALWGIVALRLLMPFSIESAFSLIPSAETVSEHVLQAESVPAEKPAYLEIITNPSFGNTVSVELDTSISAFQWEILEMNVIWFAGMAIMAIYTVGTYLSLRRKLRTAVILRDNIFQCETVHSPFVLGIIKPRIYLPYTIEGQNMAHVIAHEQAHIRRFDHWWKPLGFLLLTIHWFNPFVWVAYILLCRDIELACDEKVIAELGNEQRADYTQALVACAVNRRMIAACPLAFGEVGVKDRVKSIMNYRKPTFWIIVTALVVCMVVAVCFLTNPKANLFDNNEDIVGIISSVQNMEPAMTQNGDIIIIQNEGGLWHFTEGQQLDVSVDFENDGSYMSMKAVGYIFCGDGNEGLYTEEIFADQNVYQSSGSFTAPETGNYLFYFRNYSSSWLTLQNFNVVYRNDLEVDRIVMVHSEEQWNPSAEATITNSEEIYHILSLYQSMQVEDYSRPLSEERIVIQFYRGEDIVQDWTVSYYAEDDTVVTCSDGFGLGNRRVTSDFSYDRLLKLFEEHAYTFIPAYEPLGVSGDNVEELSRISDHVKWIDGLGIDELAPGEEIVSDFVIDVEEDGTDLLIMITWGRQPLVLKYGIRAEDGTEFFQEKPGGSSMLRMKDIPAGTYRLYVRNSEAYAGIPAYENPEEYPDVSFNAAGAILYAIDN